MGGDAFRPSLTDAQYGTTQVIEIQRAQCMATPAQE